MSRFSIFVLLTALLLISAFPMKSQDSYFPPPSDLNYDNGTLTIFPPDSLPGDPVMLLGYNILVDSVFYDNVMVDNQTDTIYFEVDYATLQPGNHVFCVTTFYNLWISDPICDSAMVIYGYELPFLEDWSSGGFTQNQWYTESGNWTVDADEGNPGPAAVFSGLPAQYNYEIPLESFAFRGDLMHVGTITLYFDIKLTSMNSTGHEKLFVQRYNWNNHTWQDVFIYSNENGSFDWRAGFISLYHIHSSGPGFKIRFVAKGINSSDIVSWYVDNIHLERRCLQSTDLEVYDLINYLKIYWCPPTGCGPWWMEWDDGMNSGISIGTGTAAEFSVAAKWTPAQLNGEGVGNYPVSKISFFPAEPQAEYSLGIWQGDSVVELVYEQPVPNPVIAQWNTITVDSTVIIDATKDLYIGYKINSLTGYPAGVDDGPAVDGSGNMMYWEDTWQTLLEINPDLDYNWNIAWLPGPDPEDPDIRYLIYRQIDTGDFHLYDSTVEWDYEDYNIEPDQMYCYKVTMEWSKYGDTCESAPTNVDCEMIVGIDDDKDESLFNIYPNPASDIIHIESEHRMNALGIYSVLGEGIIERRMNDDQYILDISNLKSGIYFLEVQSGKDKIRKKIVKN